jgi:selenocysteine-specific elongation factor
MPVVATAGHVDHGKSALVRALTGTDPDRLAVEQLRGLTIELGFAHCVTPSGRRIGFVDVPGHIDFINTMIAGVGGASAVMLIVDAVEGPRAQTYEHLDIISHLGVRQVLGVVTRADLVDAPRVHDVCAELEALVGDATGASRPVIATSAVSGMGLPELLVALDDLVAGLEIPDRGRPRLFVDRVFTIRGAGTVVTGTLVDGALEVGMRLTTGTATSRVRALQHHGEDVRAVQPGERVAVNLADVGIDTVDRGDVLVEVDRWHHTEVIDAEVVISASTPSSLRGVMVHLGTARRLASMRPIGAGNAADDGGSSRQVRVRFQRALPLAPSDRFILRDPGAGRTLGGGVVRDVAPRRRPSRVVLDPDPVAQLSQHGWIGVELAERLAGVTVAPVVGGFYSDRSVVDAARSDLDHRLDAGPVDVAPLAEWERALLAEMPGVHIVAGVAMRGEDPVLSHPVIDAVAHGWVTPPDLGDVDRAVIARLVRLGVFVEHDGVVFHVDTLTALEPVLDALWASAPEGFTIADLRTALGITRKHAMPLAACLDAIGMTRRVGDVRLPRQR